MRWSLRRGHRDADGQREETRQQPSASGSGAPDPGWRSLPPLAGSWSAPAPLTAPPSAGILTPPPARRVRSRPLDVTDPVGPEPGRVVGLAAVRATVAPVLPAAPPVPYVDEQPPLRHAATRTLVERAPLTRATEEYLGEPTGPALPPPPPSAPPAPPSPAPATPPRPAARAEPPVEAATEAGARFREALANLHKSGLPRYVSPSEGAPPGPPEPSAAPPRNASAGPDEPPPLTHRRNTLAQSRRLGLGAPVRDRPARAEHADSDGSGDADDSEPAPPPARPDPEPPHRAAPPAPPAASTATVPPPASEDPMPAPGTGSPPSPMPSPMPSAMPSPMPSATARRLDAAARPDLTSAAPLVFRSRPARPSEPGSAPRRPERAVVTRPPADLARALRSSHGIDVADVEIRRDGSAEQEARDRRARAFTRGARVFLPERAGGLDSAAVRGLLAHELVHAAQQRRLGGSLPPESSPEGAALEAEARSAERAYGGDATLTDDAPLRHAPAPVSAAWVDDRITQHALDLPQPVMPFQLNDAQQQEARWLAQEVVRDAIQNGAGGSGGSGGGLGALGGAGASTATTFGIGGMRTWDEARPQILAAINLERRNAHLPEVHDFSELSRSDQALIEQTRRMYEPQIRQNQMAEELRRELGLPPAGQGGGTSWTPQSGFQRTGAGGAQVGAAAGTPGASGVSPASVGGAVPAVPGAPGAGGRPVHDGGVGLAHAQTEQQFNDDVMLAINLERRASGLHDITYDQLSGADRAMLRQTWNQQHAAAVEAQGRDALQRQWQAQAQAQAQARATAAAAAAAPAAPAPAAHDATAHAAAHGSPIAAAPAAAAPAAHGLTSGNIRPSGQPEVDTSALNLGEISERIYDRLRSRLRTELLIDRERAGLLTDFR